MPDNAKGKIDERKSFYMSAFNNQEGSKVLRDLIMTFPVFRPICSDSEFERGVQEGMRRTVLHIWTLAREDCFSIKGFNLSNMNMEIANAELENQELFDDS